MYRQGIGISATWIVSLAVAVTACAQSATSSQTFDAGFLFIEGRYLEPPYVFQTDGQVTRVNDVVLDEMSLNFVTKGKKRREREEGRPNRSPWRKLGRELEGQSIVAVFNDRPPLILGGTAAHDLLKALTDQATRQPSVTKRPPWLPDYFEDAVWRKWLTDFEASPEFVQRASQEIERFELIVAGNEASNAAVRRLDSCAYPLTILGMGCVVLSFGHVLSHRPGLEASADDTPLSPSINRMVCLSLILVCVLSGLDLVWTILVSQTGSMRELNPLGSRLIDDPVQLVAFKIVATSLSVGLLFSLRQFAVAQKAAWWVCLVCTLLTVRWLTFNSMFVS